MELYKQISDANRIKYGTEAEKILRIIINQYSDRTHFIYEILQNAGEISHKQAIEKAQIEYEKYKEIIVNDISTVEQHFIEQIETSSKK